MSPLEVFGTFLALAAGAAAGTLVASYYIHRRGEAAVGLRRPAAGHLEVTKDAPLFFQKNEQDDHGDYLVRCLECPARWYYGPSPEISDYPSIHAEVFAHTHRRL